MSSTGRTYSPLSGDDQNPSQSLFWASTLFVALASYATLCSAVRFRRRSKILSRFDTADRSSLSRMTGAQAQAIICDIATYEFPLFYDLALRYALFKTYTIGSIAKLLISVSDLAQVKDAPKRYEDTEVLFACFALFPPNSPVLHKAVARMNYLHAPYRRCGKILNQDILYVLYTAMVEPIRFMRLYEWRSLTDLEVAALGTFWKSIGDMMDIDYAEQLGKSEWLDGTEFMDDVTQWARKYEDDYMRPLPDVQRLGSVLLDLLLSAYPRALRPLGYQVLLVMMGDRMRHSFGLPEPGVAVSALTYVLLLSRKLAIRYLALPRVSPVRFVTDPDPTTGRMHHPHYLKEPWYAAPSIWARWGPVAWITWAHGGMLPGDGGSEMKPEGFLFHDIGPRSKMGKGVEEMAQMQEQVRGMATGKCPFGTLTKH